MINSVIYCFVLLVACSYAEVHNATLEADNSTMCYDDSLSLARRYIDLAIEKSDSSGSEIRALVKRDPTIHAPGQWPGIGFDQRPRYEESAPITVRQIVNNIVVFEQIRVYIYRYNYILAAQIGPYIFSCRQDNYDLVVRQILTPTTFSITNLQTEFVYHPLPGIWWFVKCASFETGPNLDVTGVQNPGGDAGISAGALKSAVG